MSLAFRSLRAALVAASLLLAGCRRQPVDASPEAVVREFLERMKRLQSDPKDGRAVYELLSRPAQSNLAERAKRASAATGKRMGPEQMIAPAYFFPRFQAQRWATRAAGDRATVELLGVDPVEERASVPCVREEGHWRVDLALPSLPPVERRPPGPGGVPLQRTSLGESSRTPGGSPGVRIHCPRLPSRQLQTPGDGSRAFGRVRGGV
ncbi:MAG: hypothetical protein MUF34_35145 [Polyangiaceae bacterium]|jgi:hypothetical protein|nr:hypothetical protein [Polyangiaceae bacterium]